MLQTLRNKAQGIVTWVIVFLIILAFASWGIQDYIGSRNQNGHLAAIVNGHKIFKSEINNLYHKTLARYSSQGMSLDQRDLSTLKKHILSSVVNNHALEASMLNSGYVVDDDFIVSIIRNESSFQHEGKFSHALYESYLQNIGMRSVEYEQHLRQSIMLSQLKQGIVSSEFVTNYEQSNALKLINQTRDFGYTIVGIDKFKNDIQPTEQQIEDFYKNNLSKFISKEKLRIAYVELSIDDLEKQLIPTENELLSFYEANKDMFANPEMIKVKHILVNVDKNADQKTLNEAKAKTDEIMFKLKLGEDFTQVAKQVTKGNVTSSDLNWITRGEHEPEFDKAAFAISQKLQHSGVVKTSYGYHIIQLLDRVDEKLLPFSEAKHKVISKYKREQAEKMLSEQSEQLADLAFANSDSLEPITDKLGLEVKFSDWFDQDSIETGIAAHPKVVFAAFNESLKNKQSNSELLKLNEEHYVVIRVNDHKPSETLQLVDVKSNIVELLKKQQAANKAKEIGYELLTKLNEGNPPHALVKEHQLTWQVNRDISRQEVKIDNAILHKAFSLFLDEESKKTNSGFVLSDGSYAVVSLTAVNLPDVLIDSEADDKDKLLQTKKIHVESDMAKNITKQVAKIESDLVYDLYQNVLINDIKIKYYE